MTPNAPERYDPVARTLHWGMAAAIMAIWVVGHMIDALPKGPIRTEVVGLHKSIGVIMLVLVLGRLAWRVARPQPPLPTTMPMREQLLAKLGHVTLYILMLAIPTDGILMSQSGGREVAVFGLALPVMVAKNDGLRDAFKAGHGLLGWALALVLAGHVVAVLRHHLILKDEILHRMLPGR